MNLSHLWLENLITPFSWRISRRKTDPEEASFWQEGLGPRVISSPYARKDRNFCRSSWRSGAAFFLFIFAFLFLFSRSFVLQVVRGAENRRKSEENRLRFQVIRAPRGTIYDREGSVLAQNLPGFRVIWDPSLPRAHPEEEPDWEKLAQILNLPLGEISEKVNEAREAQSPVILKSSASRDETLAVETLFSDFVGIKTEVSPVRSYPQGALFSHVLGFVGEAGPQDPVSGLVGRGGLEEEFDLLLRGREGRRLLEVNVLGRGEKEVAKVEAETGLPLRTSLDLGLTKVSSEALSWGIKRSKSTGGVVIAQNPKTGKILTLLSLPSFDPNRLVSGITREEFGNLSSDPRKPLFNRALSGTYPPGSVFKLVTATAALEESIVTPQTLINCSGAIRVGAFTYLGWKAGGHGDISLVPAIGKSCDIYFYTVGGGYGGQRGVGAEKLADWARLFGLGEVLGVEQPWEAKGLIPDPTWKLREREEPWYLGNTYHMAIGQGDVLVTPLQVSIMVSAIANGGEVLRPTLLLDSEPEVLREGFVSPETLAWVKEGMRAVCMPGGTAYPLFGFSVPTAGKTGTSETGVGERTHAWFTVFAPSEDPEIVLTVFLENGGEGSHDAAPVARKILDWYFGSK